MRCSGGLLRQVFKPGRLLNQPQHVGVRRDVVAAGIGATQGLQAAFQGNGNHRLVGDRAVENRFVHAAILYRLNRGLTAGNRRISEFRHPPLAPKEWEGTLDKLLAEIKDLTPTFDFVESGRPIFYQLEIPTADERRTVLRFFTAATAKKRWLEWWQTSGKEWYCGKS